MTETLLFNKTEIETMITLLSYAKEKLEKRLDSKYDEKLNLKVLADLHKRFRSAQDNFFTKENFGLTL